MTKTLVTMIVLAHAATALAQSFVSLKDPECIDGRQFTGWTVGAQYVDLDNGVPRGRYSMLVRWQGEDIVDHEVGYDMGAYTGFHGAAQRGSQPEDANGSPGVQVDCYEGGMLIDTWMTPHRPIVGGGYNDMWGYAWAPGAESRPFVDATGHPAELVLQSNIGVALYYPTHVTGNRITGQVALFAYVRDTAHPQLHPIAIGGAAFLSNWDPVYFNQGLLSYDYSDALTRAAATAYPGWFAQDAAGDGVWFASGPISATSPNPYATTRFSEGNADAPLPPTFDADPPMPFWRVHFTQDNLLTIIDGINAHPCSAPLKCPAKGYSTDPADYVLDYAGIIAEAALASDDYDASPEQWIRNDAAKDQVAMGIHHYAFGVYQFLP